MPGVVNAWLFKGHSRDAASCQQLCPSQTGIHAVPQEVSITMLSSKKVNGCREAASTHLP